MENGKWQIQRCLFSNGLIVFQSRLFSAARRATFSARRRRKRLHRYARQNKNFVLVFSADELL